MDLCNDNETLAIVGSDIDDMAARALASLNSTRIIAREPPFSLEFLTRAEVLDLRQTDLLQRLRAQLDFRHVIPIGVGACDDVFFVVVVWNAGQLARKRLGLNNHQFHIQLSVHNQSVDDRGISSLLDGQIPAAPSLLLLDHITYALMLDTRLAEALEYAATICKQYPYSEKGFLRLADIALYRQSWKLAMLSYGQTLCLSSEDKVSAHCKKKILICSRHTEWGAIFLENEIKQVRPDLVDLILRPWPERVRMTLSDIYFNGEPPSLCLSSTQKLYVPTQAQPRSISSDSSWSRLPRFFRWLVPFHFAIMSTPRDADDITLLASPWLGIRHVITLTETPLDAAWFARLGGRVGHTFMPIPNYHPPSVEQMDIVLRLFSDESKLPILVHCGGGKGRAGVVAACYLAAFGFAPITSVAQRDPAMDGGRAIASLRAIRPSSIETVQQENFVQHWASALWKRRSLMPETVSEPPSSQPEIQGDPDLEKCDMLVLVGLPGSGKSWFAESLVKFNPDRWSWVCQDDIGGRAGVEDAVGRSRKCIILDRCNTSADDRRWFLRVALHASAPVCVWFDFTPELCIARAQMRPNHPTLPPGDRVRTAVHQMQASFIPPVLEDGFRSIVTVRSREAADALVRRLSPPAGLLKFPRTPHLLNLGAATDDDIVHPPVPAPQAGIVVITEKVDGANMGFSLATDRTVILVQNRSHYVNPASHEQFRRLGSWTSKHDTALRRILGRDKMFAERYILYGEWLAATHSVPYTRLPDRFLAFDLYDRVDKSFVARDMLEGLLYETGIELTPIVYQGQLPADHELAAMASQPSRFYDGPREGIYVKFEHNGRVTLRGKVVRKDFISGNEHWTKGEIHANGVVNNVLEDY